MIASLSMYMRPELADAHDNYWALIKERLIEAGVASPARLSHDVEEFEAWNDPGLVLSQTCGMPYRLWLHETVSLVGAPDYGLEGCPPGYYRSAFIVRGDDERTQVGDFSEAVFAYNETFSQSGYAAPYTHLVPQGFWFANRLHTGQHLGSALAVADHRADIAALDAVSWRLIREYEPFAADLRVLCWTSPTPGLPYITADQANAEVVFTAVAEAITALDESDRTMLGLKGIVQIPKSDYLAVPNPPGNVQLGWACRAR